MKNLNDLASQRNASFKEMMHRYMSPGSTDRHSHLVLVGFESESPADKNADLIALPFSSIESPIAQWIEEKYSVVRHWGIADNIYEEIIKPSDAPKDWLMHRAQLTGYGRSIQVGPNDEREYEIILSGIECAVDAVATYRNEIKASVYQKAVKALRNMVMELEAPVQLTLIGHGKEAEDSIVETITR